MFIEILFPEKCLGCAQWGTVACDVCLREKVLFCINNDGCLYCSRPGGWLTCETCIAQNRLDGLYSLFINRLLIRDIIKAYKYSYVKVLERVIYKMITQRLAEHDIPPVDLIVPVPLSSYRLRQRGFNQSLYLATVYSEVLSAPVRHLSKRRHRFTHQARLSKDLRDLNVHNVFYSDATHCPPKVLIVDDVYTTGKTVHALASLLKSLGAEEVYVSTLARSM